MTAGELERLALGCLLPGFPGEEPPDWVRRLLEAGLGGVVLYAWNVHDPEQLRSLTDALRAERPELVIAIDEEGGDVTRLEARDRQLVSRKLGARRGRRRRADAGGGRRDGL